MLRGIAAGTESPHAAATLMMARTRKRTSRRVVVFLVLVWVTVGSVLTWTVPNLLCRVKTPWSYRNGKGGSHACRRGEEEQFDRWGLAQGTIYKGLEINKD